MTGQRAADTSPTVQNRTALITLPCTRSILIELIDCDLSPWFYEIFLPDNHLCHVCKEGIFMGLLQWSV